MSHEIEPSSGTEAQSQWRNFFNYREIGPRQFAVNILTAASAAMLATVAVSAGYLVVARPGEDRGDLNEPKIHGEDFKIRTVSNEKFGSIDAYAKKVGTKVVKCLERSDETLHGDPVQDDEVVLISGNKGCFGNWTAGKLQARFSPYEPSGIAVLTITNTYSYGAPSGTELADFDENIIQFEGPFIDDDGRLKKGDAESFLARPTTHIVGARSTEYRDTGSDRRSVAVDPTPDLTAFTTFSRNTSVFQDGNGGTRQTDSKGRPVADLCRAIDAVSEDWLVGESVVCRRAG